MPARALDPDEITGDLPPLLLLVGDEELLVTRAIESITRAARRQDPDVAVSERAGADLDGGELYELLSPSLFAEAQLLVIRAAQDVRAASLPALTGQLQAVPDRTTIVVQHAGGAKGKKLLEAARKAKAAEIGCAKLTRPEQRAEFVRAEVRRAGGRIAPDAVAALVDAVGSDLRELSAVAAQLVSDCGGSVDVETVRAYHRGRAEVSGFAVADLAVTGRAGEALVALRYALGVGVPHVVIADALADGVRSIARVATAGRGDPYTLASQLGMPAWKVKRVQGHVRGWREPGVRRALRVVADLNADVKGAAADASYALERAVRQLAHARDAR